MKRQTITILVTGAGTATALSVMKGAKTQHEFTIRIIACDKSDNVSGRYFSDRFYTIPGAGSPSFIPALKKIVKKEQVQLIIPIFDLEFTAFTKTKQAFSDLGATVVLSDLKVINICTNKYKTMKFFDSLGLPRPKSYTPAQIKHHTLHFPLFIKPSLFGRSTIDAYRVTTKKDLNYYMRVINKPIIQEYINGKEITADCLNDFQGRFLGAVLRERTETKNGLSVKGVVIKNDILLGKIKRLTESLPIIGPSNIQCFRVGSRYIFSEINPRFAGTHAFTVAAGLNSIHILCKLIIGQKVVPKDIPIAYNLRMVRYWNELFITRSGKVTKSPL